MSEVIGVKELQRALERFAREMPQKLESTLRAEAEAIRVEANSAVPVASGELAASSFAASGVTKGGARAHVGYIDPKAPAVHEGFHFGKKRKTPHQFWLQTVANRASAGFAQRLAQAARAALS